MIKMRREIKGNLNREKYQVHRLEDLVLSKCQFAAKYLQIQCNSIQNPVKSTEINKLILKHILKKAKDLQ